MSKHKTVSLILKVVTLRDLYVRYGPKKATIVIFMMLAPTLMACSKLTPQDLTGEWFASSRLMLAKFNEGIVITDRSIAWGGVIDNPECITTYTIEGEPYGTTFIYNRFPKIEKYTLAEGNEFTTYKLKITPKKCVNDLGLGYLRFTLHSTNKNYTDLTMYAPNGKATGWSHLQKINE